MTILEKNTNLTNTIRLIKSAIKYKDIEARGLGVKDEIKDTLDCDNVIIKILRHDESMPEQYRIVGSVSMSEENILFKITSFNSDRKYFAEVQKMLTNYVNDILVDQDEDKSDNKSDCEFGDFGDFCE